MSRISQASDALRQIIAKLRQTFGVVWSLLKDHFTSPTRYEWDGEGSVYRYKPDESEVTDLGEYRAKRAM